MRRDDVDEVGVANEPPKSRLWREPPRKFAKGTLAATHGAWQRLLDWLLNRISGRDMKKWHALLFGKNPDQQLWAIKPPRGGLRDSRVRCWVEQTLQVGGYDVASMLAEWEIHWRRRGL